MPAYASSRQEKVERFEARAVALTDVAGDVTIAVGTGPGMTVRIAGRPDQVEAIAFSVERDVLTLRGKPGAAGGMGAVSSNSSSSTSTVVSGNGVASSSVTVFSSGSGTAVSTVTRNGETVTVVSTGEPPLEVTVEVPAGTPATVRGAVGRLVVGDLKAPVTLALKSGDARLGRIGDAVLEIPGSGQITADHVEGDLKIALDGSGAIRVADGALDELDIALAGSGTVTVDGRARRAALRLSGAGMITVAEVVERPDIRTGGAGMVKVGNW